MDGEEVRRIRRKLGLKQAELAEKLGVHWVTISRWETNAVRVGEPVAQLLRLLAKAESGRKAFKKKR